MSTIDDIRAIADKSELLQRVAQIDVDALSALAPEDVHDVEHQMHALCREVMRHATLRKFPVGTKVRYKHGVKYRYGEVVVINYRTVKIMSPSGNLIHIDSHRMELVE